MVDKSVGLTEIHSQAHLESGLLCQQSLGKLLQVLSEDLVESADSEAQLDTRSTALRTDFNESKSFRLPATCQMSPNVAVSFMGLQMGKEASEALMKEVGLAGRVLSMLMSVGKQE